MVRNNLEVIYSILMYTKKPIKSSVLISKANVDWKLLTKRYAPALLEGGYIKKVTLSESGLPLDGKTKYLYVRTPDGRELMRRIAAIYHDLGWLGKLTGRLKWA